MVSGSQCQKSRGIRSTSGGGILAFVDSLRSNGKNCRGVCGETRGLLRSDRVKWRSHPPPNPGHSRLESALQAPSARGEDPPSNGLV